MKTTEERFTNYLKAKGYTVADEQSGTFDKVYKQEGPVFTINGKESTEALAVDLPANLAKGHFWFAFKDNEGNDLWGNLYKDIGVIEAVDNTLYYIEFGKVRKYLLAHIDDYFETINTKGPRGSYDLGYALPVEELQKQGFIKELANW